MRKFKCVLFIKDNSNYKKSKINEYNKSSCYLILIGVVLLSIMLSACNKKIKKTYNVGVINTLFELEENLVGFKEGMTELGYIEGKNIHYIYDGPTMDLNKLPEAAQKLVEAKVDMILSVTTPATLAAKEATKDSGIPVVFTTVTDPVGAAIVESMQHPGGSITGVTFGFQEGQRLEWLVRIVPEINEIYVPYNPNDKSPVLALKMVQNTAEKLGVKLITREVYDSETLKYAVFNIPPEADAVFLLPDSFLSTRIMDILTEAAKRKLPTSTMNIGSVRSRGVFTSFGNDLKLCGKQAARLADQIFKGISPSDLPVETAEFFLAINLKVAETIGLTIPDEILKQADIIIR